MAAEVTNYKCLACTGPLRFDGASGKLVCDFCDSTYEVAEVEAMMKEQNDAAAAAMKANADSKWDTDGMSEDWGNDAKGMKTYTCKSCGAELICDETTAATCCPYCGNQTVVPGQFAGSLKPEYVIPFKTDKEAAKKALKKHYEGKKLLPNSFVSGNRIEDIQGVYVPFWLYDCQASGDIDYSATTKTVKKVGNKEITTTKYYDVKRSGSLDFKKVPVDASTRMPDGHMDCIEPYDYKELKDFSMAYMPGFLADKYDVSVEDCGARMQERCQATFESEMEDTVTGYDTQSVKHKAVKVEKGDVHYALMPVWLLGTKWNDQSFIFAMNGQTGKLVGDLPVDKGKYWKYLIMWTVILAAVINVLNLIMFNMTGGTLVFMGFILPLIIGFVIVSIMKGNMKSIVAQKAGAYIAKGGLKLS
ncbi:MAG: hypothetical protein KBS83_07405, partial [Lachnospiraceae bacterium]|nr:hypothetical protein [Candidatus Equihabitans merdae]